MEINIPAGIFDGQSIALRGFGGQGYAGGPNGDLMVRVSVRGHKHYERNQNDIYLKVPISAIDIMNQVELEVPTPYGREKIHLKEKMTSMDKITIKGKGFKSLRTGRNGDLIIIPEVYVPKFNHKHKEKINDVIKKEKDKTHDKFLKEFDV